MLRKERSIGEFIDNAEMLISAHTSGEIYSLEQKCGGGRTYVVKKSTPGYAHRVNRASACEKVL